VPFSFWSALYQHDNAQQIWLNVCSAIILIFFLQFFSSFLIWSTSDLSHKTHIWSFSSDPLLTFLPSSLGCIFFFFSLLAFRLANHVVQKKLSALVSLFKPEIKGQSHHATNCLFCFWMNWWDVYLLTTYYPGVIFLVPTTCFVFV